MTLTRRLKGNVHNQLPQEVIIYCLCGFWTDVSTKKILLKVEVSVVLPVRWLLKSPQLGFIVRVKVILEEKLIGKEISSKCLCTRRIH